MPECVTASGARPLVLTNVLPLKMQQALDVWLRQGLVAFPGLGKGKDERLRLLPRHDAIPARNHSIITKSRRLKEEIEANED
ncbi:hypothetical protein GCM10011378_00640 [Hymenobacter glacieicola]|uniref:Uncharacterized protein n=1 Tax=Hymenobacter glacieicola TaxID=1562124 RepID=A0ABQ1WFD6_9BACT|nr:hypothetical protein GCM10011378_00640 [Hymenobacter glacieicola]